MRGLSLLGKLKIFNTLGISKILYVSSMTQVPKNLVNELKRFKSISYGIQRLQK